MPGMCRSACFVLIIGTMSCTYSYAGFWDYCRSFNPFGWFWVTGTGAHSQDADDEVSDTEETPSNPNAEANFTQEEAESPSCYIEEEATPLLQPGQGAEWFNQLNKDIRQRALARGMTIAELDRVLGNNQAAIQSATRIMLELMNYRRAAELEHHGFLRHTIRLTCAIGGSVNRIVLPENVALAAGIILSTGAFVSANLVSVSGANNIKFEGIQSISDLFLVLIAGGSVAIDDAMTFKHFMENFHSVAASTISLYFMTVGLGPILIHKIWQFCRKIWGLNPDLITLQDNMVDLFADLIVNMAARDYTVASPLQHHISVFDDLLGMGSGSSRFYRILDATGLYGLYARRRNTLLEAQRQGFNDRLLYDQRFYTPLELILQKEIESRAPRSQVATNLTIFMACLIPGLAYGFGDSASASGLLQTESGEQLSCDSTIATMNYIMTQGGLLAVMTGKCLTAAQCGTENIQRFGRWGYGLATGTGQPVARTDKALNTFAVFVALLYAGNVAINMYGDIQEDECLGRGTAAEYALPTLVALGGFLFNVGCGPALKEVNKTLKALFRQILRLCSCGSTNNLCADKNLQALLNLVQAGLVTIPQGVDGQPDYAQFIHDQGFEFNEEALQQALGSVQQLLEHVAINIPQNNYGFYGAPYQGVHDAAHETAHEESQGDGALESGHIDDGTDTLGNHPFEHSDWLNHNNLNPILGMIVQHDDQAMLNAIIRQYLVGFSDIMLHHGWQVLFSNRQPNSIYHLLRAMLTRLNRLPLLTTDALINKIATLLADLSSHSSGRSSPSFRRMLASIGHSNLVQVHTELSNGYISNTTFFQLVAYELQQDIYIVVNHDGAPQLLFIDHNQPESIQELPEQALFNLPGDTLVILNNGLDHWALVGLQPVNVPLLVPDNNLQTPDLPMPDNNEVGSWHLLQ